MNRIAKSGKLSFSIAIFAAISAAILVLSQPKLVMARHFNATTATQNTSPDVWCQGSYSDTSRTYELCIDYNINLIPTINNVQTLGNSTYKWLNVYATTFTGNATGVIPANSASSTVALPVVSTTSLAALTASQVGLVFQVKDSLNAFAGICVSTAAAIDSFIYIGGVGTSKISTACH